MHGSAADAVAWKFFAVANLMVQYAVACSAAGPDAVSVAWKGA